MQIRVVRLNSRNPLVGAVLLVVVLALLAFLLTAGMALVAGGAVLGGVGYALRRVLGGARAAPTVMPGSDSLHGIEEADPLVGGRLRPLGEEVFPPGERSASPRVGDGRPE